MSQGMQNTLLEGQWLTLSKHLEHGLKSLLKRLQKVSFFSVMADECTDITAVWINCMFSVVGRSVTPVEFFFYIVPL